MIALQFAPVPSTGAYRAIEFAKRLPTHGIRPTVVTIDVGQAENIFGVARNPALLEGMPSDVRVVEIRSNVEPKPESPLKRLLRLLTTYDDSFDTRFRDDLLRVARDLGRERNFAAVYATAPPFGATHLGAHAAAALKRPLLLDMRDAWAEWAPGPRVTRRHHIRAFADERRAFEAADRIIAVTPETLELFRGTHPKIPADRFTVIPNGLPDLEGVADAVEWRDDGETLDIGYVGAFYWTPKARASWRSPHRYLQYDPGTEDWSYRSPLYFFLAWKALAQKAPEKAARMRFHLVGRVPDWLPGMAEVHGLAEQCVFHGFKPKEEVPAFLDSMTCLLATSAKRIGGKDYSLASKSFEYVNSGRPILAFVCDGAQKRFFEGAGGALFFDPDDPEGSADLLAALASDTRTLPVDKLYISDYLLDRTSGQMAAELKALADRAERNQTHAP